MTYYPKNIQRRRGSALAQTASQSPRHDGAAGLGNHWGLDQEATDFPISLYKGEKRETVTDLSLNTPAGALAFTRTYRQSKQATYTFMGLGWTHNYTFILTKIPGTPNRIVVQMDNAAEVHFAETSPGANVYAGDLGSTATVSWDGTRYMLLAQDKTQYVFDTSAAGAQLSTNVVQITARVYPSGETLTYTYSSTSKKLTSVTDSYGKGYQFTYLSHPTYFDDGKLQRVEAVSSGSTIGQFVVFGYVQEMLGGSVNGTGALLSTVQDVRGNVWTYQYYGQHVAETDSTQKDFLTVLLSPAVDKTGQGLANSPIVVKKLSYQTRGAVITAISQFTGDSALRTDFAFRPGGQNMTTQTVAGKTTTHRFNGGLYLGPQDPAGNASSRLLDGQLRPAAQIDANNHATQMLWSTDAKFLQQVTDALGHTTAFSYDTRTVSVNGVSTSADRLSVSTDAQGRTTRYSYVDSRNPRLPISVQIYDTDGKTRLSWQAFVYDSAGRTLTEQTLDPTSGLVQQQASRTYYTTGNGNGLLQSVTQQDLVNPANNTSTTYFYDSAGRSNRTKQSATFGSCISACSVHDGAGNVVASLCNYDPGANPDPTSVTQALALYNPALPDKNRVTINVYDALGRRIQTTTDAGDPYALTTLTVYDSLSRVVRTLSGYVPSPVISDPYIHTRADFAHGPNNDQNLITDTTYNERGFVKTQTDVLGNVTLLGYDDAGRLIKAVAFASQPAYDNSYGPHGDPSLSLYVASSAPDQDLVSATQYDPVGNRVKTTDALGNVSLTGFDALNRVVRTLRNASQPGYNLTTDPTLAQYVASSAPDQDVIDYTDYDALGHVTRSQDTLGSWTLFGYDGLGRQVRVVRSASQPTYNLAADPSLSRYVASSAPDQDLISQTAYDSLGRTLYTTDVLGNRNWPAYDGLNRVVRTVTNTTGTATDDSAHDPRSPAYSAVMQPDQDIVSSTVYDLNGYVLYTVDPLGRRTWQGYDSVGRQIRTVVNALGTATDGSAQDPRSPTYVAASASDADLITQTVYNGQGRVAATIDAAGNRTQYVYDALGRPIQTIANYTSGSFHATTPDQDLIATTTYDLGGRVMATVDPRGMKMTYTYDRAGRRLTVTQAAGSGQATTSYTCYDKGGRVLRVIQNWIGLKNQPSPDLRDANGRWLWTNPSQGNTADRNLITVYSLDRAGRQTSVADPLGNLAQISYARDGALLSSTDPLGVVTVYRYDALRRRRLTVQSYTAQNRLGSSLADPATWVWNTTTSRWTDGNGVFVHDGNSADPTDQNVIAQVIYDKGGRALSQREPNGNLTRYTYDKLNRRVQLTDPLNHVWTTRYRLVGNGMTQTLSTDPLGNLAVQTTDRLGRLALLQYPKESAPKPTPDVTFVYDKLGNRLASSENNGQRIVRKASYSYDRARRMTQVAFDVNGDGSLIQPIGYQYDAGGLRLGLTLPGSLTISYQYNPRGQLTQLTDWAGQSTRYFYDSAGRLTQAQRPNRLLSQYRYDADGRLLTLRHSASGHSLGSFTYTLDARGNRTQVVESLARAGTPGSTTLTATDPSIAYYRGVWSPSGSNQMSVDSGAALQVVFLGTQAVLTMGTGPDYSLYDIYLDGDLWSSADGYAAATGAQTFTIAFNNDGPHILEIRNRPERNVGNTSAPATYRVMFQTLVVTGQPADVRTTSYGYDRVSRLLSATSYSGQNTAGTPLLQYGYTYDLAGNRLTATAAGTTTTYTYNGTNQLQTVKVGSGNPVTYSYDTAGRLTNDGVNTYTWDSANRLLSVGATSYLYNGLGQRVQQTVSGTVTQYLLDIQPGLWKVLAATQGTNTTRYVHGPLGIHEQQNSDGTWHYPIQDGLGSVRGVLDTTNVPQESRVYDPYGNEMQQSGSQQTAFGFTGEETDGTGFVNLRARYYNPVIGQFPSLDPLEGDVGSTQTLNRYAYVQGNVVNMTDPSGFCTLDSSGRTATNCHYNRAAAVDFAVTWGYPANNKSEIIGLNIGVGTDCTNFVSQALFFGGGFPQTDNWYYTSSKNGNIQYKSPAWAGTNFFLDYITGLSYQDITPSAKAFRVVHNENLNSKRPSTLIISGETDYGKFYQDFVNAQYQLQIGDLIFYVVPPQTTSNEKIDHVGIVIGWGCPYDSNNPGTYQCGNNTPTYPPGYTTTYSAGLVPWIIDHGLVGSTARKRPYNEVGYFGDIPIIFVQLPDVFTVKNVRSNTQC